MEWIGVTIVAKEIGGKSSGRGVEKPQSALGGVDEGQEVSSTIEKERDEVVEMRVEALVDMVEVL